MIQIAFYTTIGKSNGNFYFFAFLLILSHQEPIFARSNHIIYKDIKKFINSLYGNSQFTEVQDEQRCQRRRPITVPHPVEKRHKLFLVEGDAVPAAFFTNC